MQTLKLLLILGHIFIYGNVAAASSGKIFPEAAQQSNNGQDEFNSQDLFLAILCENISNSSFNTFYPEDKTGIPPLSLVLNRAGAEAVIQKKCYGKQNLHDHIALLIYPFHSFW